MKDKELIEAAIAGLDEFGASRFPGMTYEQGVAEALRWVLGEISDEEFGAFEE